MNAPSRSMFTRALIVSLPSLAVLLTACGGGIESSPLRKEFNAALDHCEGIQNQVQRAFCFDDARNDYTAKYEAWRQRTGR